MESKVLLQRPLNAFPVAFHLDYKVHLISIYQVYSGEGNLSLPRELELLKKLLSCSSVMKKPSNKNTVFLHKMFSKTFIFIGA